MFCMIPVKIIPSIIPRELGTHFHTARGAVLAYNRFCVRQIAAAEAAVFSDLANARGSQGWTHQAS